MSDLTETQRLTIRNEALVKLDGFEMDAAAATYLSHALSPVVAQMLADERERIAQIVAAERLIDDTGHEADDAYNQAINDALRAIRKDQP